MPRDGTAFASPPLRSAIKGGRGTSPKRSTPRRVAVHESIVASGAKENKGLKQASWRKSVGGTPLRDPALTRLGGGEMEVALSQALVKMRSDVMPPSPGDGWSDDSPAR